MGFAYKIKVKTYSTSTIKRYHIIHYTNSEHEKVTNCNTSIQNFSDEVLYQMTTDLNNNYKHVRLNIFGIIYFPPLLQSL